MIKVVIANTNICRIYEYNKRANEVTLIYELNHPENKLKNLELVSDKPGHAQIGQASRTAYEPKMEPKEVAIDNFSREIAKQLNQARINNSLEEIILVAPPRMHGFIAQHLNKHVKDLITHTIQKDIVNLPEHELPNFLKENTKLF